MALVPAGSTRHCRLVLTWQVPVLVQVGLKPELVRHNVTLPPLLVHTLPLLVPPPVEVQAAGDTVSYTHGVAGSMRHWICVVPVVQVQFPVEGAHAAPTVPVFRQESALAPPVQA